MTNFFSLSFIILSVFCLNTTSLTASESRQPKKFIDWPYDEDGNPTEDDGWNTKSERNN